MDKRYRDHDLSDFSVSAGNVDAMGAAEAWLKEPYDLFLYGEPGAGKTMLATICLARRLDEEDDEDEGAGGVGYFVRNSDLIEAFYDDVAGIDEAIDADAWRTSKAFLRFLRQAMPLLVIDDMAREKLSPSAFVDYRIEALIRGRGELCLPTIITSNLAPEMWGSRYGEPLQDYIERTYRVVHVGKV